MRIVEQVADSVRLRALSDENRLAILSRLMEEPATISMLGVEFERHPAWIRHHVKVLMDAGLVELHEMRTTRNYTEKFYRSSAPAYIVNLLLRPDVSRRNDVVIAGSHDFALELLADASPTHDLVANVTGSLDGLVALRQGQADIAGCHLLDVETAEYNVPYARRFFPDRDIRVITLANREQGLMIASGNPHTIRRVSDLEGTPLRFVGRNRGSGTRIWLDRHLRAQGIDPSAISGYDEVVMTHTRAAELIAAGSADAAVGVRAAADQYGLHFIPLFEERYDIVVPEDALAQPQVVRVIENLHVAKFRRLIEGIPGYSTTETGDEHLVVA